MVITPHTLLPGQHFVQYPDSKFAFGKLGETATECEQDNGACKQRARATWVEALRTTPISNAAEAFPADCAPPGVARPFTACCWSLAPNR